MAVPTPAPAPTPIPAAAAVPVRAGRLLVAAVLDGLLDRCTGIRTRVDAP